MRKTKYYTSGFLIAFLMLFIVSLHLPISSTAYDNDVNLSADAYSESWSKKIKSGPQLYGSFIEIIDNHTYVIGSIGEYFTSDDIYLAKFDSSGVKEWEQTWGGSEYDYIKGYAVDSENCIYIAGITSTFYIGFTGSMFLLKYNTSGNLLWSKKIDPFDSNRYNIHSIQTGINDSIYISSTLDNSSNSKVFISKLNSSGNVFWTQEIEMDSEINNLKTQIDSVGNIYINVEGYHLNTKLFKINTSGSRQWDYDLGDVVHCFGMKLDLDDNIIMTGISYSLDYSNCDAWILKINNAGNLTKKIICKSYLNYSSPRAEVWFLDSIFILLDSSLFEYNYSLSSKWNYTFGMSEGGIHNFGITSDKSMYLIHYNYGDITILRFNRSGSILSNFKWGGSYYCRSFDSNIDSQDNLYIIFTIGYINVWNEYTALSFLVKNPKNDAIAIYLEQMVEDGEIFIFSLLGIMSFISVILVIITLKPKSRRNKKTL